MNTLATANNTTQARLDMEAIRADFPILTQQINGKPLIYLDNAATAQKPKAVIEALDQYYREYNANIHRGIHRLSEKATGAYEAARQKIKTFINADKDSEIIYVRGTTEAINLVAQSFGRPLFTADDEIIITELEHHSNIVPWQLLSEQTGAKLNFIPINESGELELEKYEQLLNKKTRLVALSHISNALGTINPIQDMIQLAHSYGAKVLIDGAQAVPHIPIDVQKLDCDFYAFSGHKLFAPTGIGVLYGKHELLDTMAPYQGGGDMIRTVSMAQSTYNVLPHKFEAGTPNIAGGIGLGAAIDYLTQLDYSTIAQHEQELLAYATEQVTDIEPLRLIGTAKDKTSILSFTLDGIHPHDIGTLLDNEGIAIRAGHHCAMPIMEHFKIPATARASLSFYNTRSDIDALVLAINKCIQVFS